MRIFSRYIVLLRVFLILGLVSCGYEFPENPTSFSSGTVCFERYVNIGGSISSGMMNGALYFNGQQNSLGAMLARQFLLARGSSFYQPVVESGNGYNEFAQPGPGVSGRFAYRFPSSGSVVPEIITLPGEPLAGFPGEKSVLTDFGLPFLKSFELNDLSLAQKNKYFQRMAIDPGVVSLLGQVMESDPTFFTLWIGVDDVLNYALSGGQGNPVPSPSSIGTNDITPAEVFEEALIHSLNTLLTNPRSKGAVANIPNLNDLTYFFYIPYDLMRLTNTEIANANALFYDAFNQAVLVNNKTPDADFRPYIDFRDNGFQSLYAQPVIIIDDSLRDATYPDGVTPLEKYRQLEPGEMVLFSLPLEELPAGLGWMNPLPQEYYLSKSQAHKIQASINAYNAAILQAVESSPERLVLVDLNAMFRKYARPSRIDGWGTPESTDIIFFNGVPVMFDLSLNGVISLDGLFPNERGNALIANEFISAINQGFGAAIPLIDINIYVGNTVNLD